MERVSDVDINKCRHNEPIPELTINEPVTDNIAGVPTQLIPRQTIECPNDRLPEIRHKLMIETLIETEEEIQKVVHVVGKSKEKTIHVDGVLP